MYNRQIEKNTPTSKNDNNENVLLQQFILSLFSNNENNRGSNSENTICTCE
jgi:hypothetical protein